MTFRARLLVTFLLAVLVPMITLSLFVRNEMTDRIAAQYESRVEALITVIEEDLAQESAALGTALEALRTSVIDDNRLRRAVIDRDANERGYLLDYAGRAMQVTGLSVLQIQDDAGRIISSGHFRNEFDRLEPELPKLLAGADNGTALIAARAPDAPFLALARVDSFQMGNRLFTVVAGRTVGSRFLARLARDPERIVTLYYPGGAFTSDGRETLDASQNAAVVRELRVPFVDGSRAVLTEATIQVSNRLDELHAVRRSVDRWILVAVIVTAAFCVVLVSALASRVSRPLEELAEKTSRIDLDRLDIEFETGRNDEIGSLSRLLGAMTARLRASAVLLRDAERRATLGELARQVNHDIKNGLTPIRNVFRHVREVSVSDPGALSSVLAQREQTVESSLSYLENLASNYARLSPRGERRACDVGEIARRVVADMRGTARARLEVRLCEGAVVQGDPVSLRRVLENLVANAIDSLEGKTGSVEVSTELVLSAGSRGTVRIVVADNGAGMNEEQQARVFDDFYTTKDNGTGLGLSIVRRLVMDLDGSIRFESEAGSGTRFIVEIPMAGEA